jgi:DNA-binding NarL/FixJ family response regulator
MAPLLKTRVMIVNNHPIMRVGLRQAVQRETDLELVAEVADEAEALLQFELCHPDVVLIDLQLPHGSGPHAIAAIHRLCPGSPIVALTTFPGEAHVPAGNAAGPIVFVSKAAPSEEIMAAVRAAERSFRHDKSH